jgi:hypothetical protein
MIGLCIEESINILRKLKKSRMRQWVSLKNQSKGYYLQNYENNLETKPDYESKEVLH